MTQLSLTGRFKTICCCYSFLKIERRCSPVVILVESFEMVKSIIHFSKCATYTLLISDFCMTRDKEKVEKIVSSLGLKVMARDLGHSDPKVLLSAICRQWLPVSSAVLCILCSRSSYLSLISVSRKKWPETLQTPLLSVNRDV